MNKEIIKKFDNVENLIGNTPLVEIKFLHKGCEKRIFAKVEHYNFTGSIKDRMAFYILKKAYKSGQLNEKMTIVEATSGNTGISFAAIGRLLGNKVIIYMPEWMSDERKKILKSFGAEIVLVSREEGGFIGSIAMTEELAKNNPKVFLPCQFSNYDNVEAHYLTTGPEIYKALNKIGLKVDAFIAGVGTGGTVMGIGKYLKKKNSKVKIYPLEPKSSPVLTKGVKCGSHRIQGISDEFVPSILNLNELDHIVSVDDGDAIIMAQKISKCLGLGVGISSGANFIGAVKVLEELGKDSVVTTVFADDNKKYLSTDLMKEEEIKDEYISNDIELISIKAL